MQSLEDWVECVVANDDGLDALPQLADWLEDREDARHVRLRNYMTLSARLQLGECLCSGASGSRAAREFTRDAERLYGVDTVAAFLLAAGWEMILYYRDRADEEPNFQRASHFGKEFLHLRRLYRFALLTRLRLFNRTSAEVQGELDQLASRAYNDVANSRARRPAVILVDAIVLGIPSARDDARLNWTTASTYCAFHDATMDSINAIERGAYVVSSSSPLGWFKLAERENVDLLRDWSKRVVIE